MIFKLIALGLVAANPTPLAAKVADDRWADVWSIKGIAAAEINDFIVNYWGGGLTINDFKWIEGEWFEYNGEKAYERTVGLGELYTTFYERLDY